MISVKCSFIGHISVPLGFVIFFFSQERLVRDCHPTSLILHPSVKHYQPTFSCKHLKMDLNQLSVQTGEGSDNGFDKMEQGFDKMEKGFEKIEKALYKILGILDPQDQEHHVKSIYKHIHFDLDYRR